MEDVNIEIKEEIIEADIADSIVNVDITEGDIIEVDVSAIDMITGSFSDPDTFVTDGINKTYPTTNKFKSKTTLLFLDGIYQGLGVDYAEDSGRQSTTFVNTPASGLNGEIRYVKD